MRMWQIIGVSVFWLTWPAWRLILRFTTRTRALIMHGNRVLVVKPWLGNGKWGLPGGGIKTNEDALTAVIREVKEETAVMLKRTDCKKIGNVEYKSSGLRFVYSLYMVKLARTPEVERQKGEISALAWIEKNKLTKHNANSDVLQALYAGE